MIETSNPSLTPTDLTNATSVLETSVLGVASQSTSCNETSFQYVSSPIKYQLYIVEPDLFFEEVIDWRTYVYCDIEPEQT